MPEQRTDWVEDEVARFLGFPLTAETVLLRPTYRDGPRDREVVDVMSVLRDEALLFSLKSQQDPMVRRGFALAAQLFEPHPN